MTHQSEQPDNENLPATATTAPAVEKPSPLAVRAKLNSEWHARPVAIMEAPYRCSHQVFHRDMPVSTVRNNFVDLCATYGQMTPNSDSRYHLAQIGSALVKWEGHTEADSVTCLVPGNGSPPFSEIASQLAPAELQTIFGGSLICGVKVEVLKQPVDAIDRDTIRSLLGADNLYGGPVADGKASLWSSFSLDAEGYTRIVLIDHELPTSATGRLLQRILESESYRMQAMTALPLARQTMSTLSTLEARLGPLMAALAKADKDIDHEALLTQLSIMAARIEHLAATSSYRFAAARAYSRIVEQRLRELREERVITQPRYSVFLLRSLQPAMRTCEAAERRIDELAQRIARAITLLNSMVTMTQTRQSHQMMEEMSRNAAIQVRLQQAVEGFSIFVISYYALGLFNYMLEAAQASGLSLEPRLITGVAAPGVLLSVWLISRWVRKSATKKVD